MVEQTEHDIHWKWGVLMATVNAIDQLYDDPRFSAWRFADAVEKLLDQPEVQEALIR